MNDLRKSVVDAVSLKVNNSEPFTTVDISHPIIAKDQTVRHRQVREIINDMWANGELGNYTVTTITVYPDGGAVNARLFHPDDPSFDVSSYTGVNQTLIRDNVTPALSFNHKIDPLSPKPRKLSIIDSDGDTGSGPDGSMILSQSITGNKVSAQCEVQQKNSALNVPRILVSKAGLVSGDKVSVQLHGASLKISKGGSDQSVDAEGRIRIYGKHLESLGKGKGQSCQALLVSDGPNTYIQIQ